MLYIDQSIARIRAYLNVKKVAKSRLALEAGVPEGCVRNVHSKDWNPTKDTLRAVESAIPEDFVLPVEHTKPKTNTRSK